MKSYIYIDIGRRETKILEITKSRNKVAILNLAEMRDMSGFIAPSGSFRNIEGFCHSLRVTLEKAQIKSRQAYICSSVFGIQHRSITDSFKSVTECQRKFHQQFDSTLMVTDWQYYGEMVQNSTTKQHLRMVLCQRTMLQKFLSAMKSIGITVLGLESEITAASELIQFHAYDFETPSTCIVYIGSDSVNCQVFKSGALVLTKKLVCDLPTLAETLAEKFEIPTPVATNALYDVGVINSINNSSALAAVGITSAAYFSTIKGCVGEFTEKLASFLSAAKARFNLDGVQVLLTGGILSTPGLADMLVSAYKSDPCTVIEVASQIEAGKTIVTNTTQRPISSKFGLCIGMAVKSTAVKKVNLIKALASSGGLAKAADSEKRNSTLITANVLSAVSCIAVIACVLFVTVFTRPAPTVESEQHTLAGVAVNTPRLSVGDLDVALDVSSEIPIETLGVRYESLTPNIVTASPTGLLSAVSAGQGYIRMYTSADSMVLPVTVAENISKQTIEDVIQISISKSFDELQVPSFAQTITNDSKGKNIIQVMLSEQEITEDVFIKLETLSEHDLIRTVTYQDSVFAVDGPRSKFKLNFSNNDTVHISVAIAGQTGELQVIDLTLVYEKV